jgi:hypothetical protein
VIVARFAARVKIFRGGVRWGCEGGCGGQIALS